MDKHKRVRRRSAKGKMSLPVLHRASATSLSPSLRPISDRQRATVERAAGGQYALRLSTPAGRQAAEEFKRRREDTTGEGGEGRLESKIQYVINSRFSAAITLSFPLVFYF